uniref:tetraspanin-8-like isoform X2 n=1 Tax=Oncorhynchus gorbuscha TaxID=8017 RepID=UPI001EAF10D5|nr:tetraspanin-8-like isoform X2 [Oncorhynchus gorbuscha]XP_046193046.1 tetraspanin-8-like isoform X2 [Oncorhynchus gorbuscha]
MCCSCSIRGWLLFFTILQVIGGMSFIVTPWKYYRSSENDLDERLSPVRWTIFTAGVVSFLLGITGLHGARKKNKNFLITYSVGSCLRCFGLGFLTYYLPPQLPNMMKAWYEGYVPLHTNGRDVVPGLMQLQTIGECCGLVNGYKDWGSHVPSSCTCYPLRLESCVFTEHGFVYKQPCMDLIVKIYMDMNIVRNTCIFYVVITAIVMLLALVMTRRIQKASSAEVTMDLSYRNVTNMEMATTPQAPPMLPATQAPPMLPATQAPPMLPATQAPLHASSYYQPPPPYQYDGKH